MLLLGGCTTRTLTITSDPDGADLVVDNVFLGRTPHTMEFRYGGEHEIVLFKRRHATRVVRYDSERFWFDQFPVDLFTDLGPWQAEDHQELHVKLEPSASLAAFERDPESWLKGLDERADVLRRRAREIQLAAPPVAPLLQPAPQRSAGSASRPSRQRR